MAGPGAATHPGPLAALVAGGEDQTLTFIPLAFLDAGIDFYLF